MESVVRTERKPSDSPSDDIASLIALMPYIRTAKPIMIPPSFLTVGFFMNIARMIPTAATIPVRTLEEKMLPAPDPPSI